jgi:hypothetical protein
VGTIGTGAWESSTVVASAYLDAQTAHLNVTQSFTGAKTFGAATQFNSTVTIGANDAGHDVILYGNAASANVTWDASVDDLIFNGAARIIVPNGQLVLGSVALSSTASELNLLDALDRGSIIYGNASGATTVLGQGGAGTVLTSDGTDISWSATAAASGDVTGITSVINAALALGRDADNQIKFGTDDQIVFEVAGGDGVTFKASGEIEATSLDISGNADIDGTLEADAITLGGTALGSLYSPIAGSSSIATVGTVTAGAWESSTVVASAYLDAQTAHLNVTQSFTGAKTFGAATQFNSTITVGANDAGHDVILYGNAASANVTWDASVDDLIFNGAARLIVPNGQLVVGSVALTSTASELNLLDALDRGSIIYGNASGATTVLGQGGAGTVLTSDGTDISWAAAASSGHTIQEEGSGLTARANLNFVGAGVTATDDSGNNATKVTVAASGASLPFTNSNGGSDAIALTSAAIGESLVTDTSPQLGGNLDVNGQSIVSDASNENIPITPHGTGSVVISKADINGGAIDATAIGATSASTGAFTTLDATGDISGSTVNADGDTSAGDNAVMGYTAAEGLILTGQGSTSDVTIKNDADATVMSVATGGTQTKFTGTGNITSLTASSGTEASMNFTPASNNAWQLGAGVLTAATFQLYENGAGATRITVKEGGNVGIGTVAPSTDLEVMGPAGDFGTLTLSTAETTIVNTDPFGRIDFKAPLEGSGGNAVYPVVRLEARATETFDATHNESDLLFMLARDGGATEKMRICSDGEFKVIADKSNGGAVDITNAASSTPRGMSIKMTGGVTGTTSEYFLYLHDNAGERAVVLTNGNIINANNSYGAISDIKIKQDITDARDYWDDFKAVRFRKFRRKEDVLADADAPAQFGVVAQELETVFPGLVSESNDTEERQVPVLDEDGNPTYTTDLDGNEVEVTEKELIDLGTTTKSAKYSVLSQIGLKVVQELQTRLEAAEAEITALKSA